MNSFRPLASSNWWALWVLGLTAVSAQADQTAQKWFERMGQATESLNYHGTFVHTRFDQVEAMEVLHKVVDGRVFERMTSQSSPAREFIRSGEKLHCIVAARKEVMVDLWQNQNPLMSSLPVYSKALEELYRFELSDDAKPVAGRETVSLAIVPRDGYRYGYRILLDKDTAMPLKCDSVDQNGQLIESLQFTSIEYDPDFAEKAFEATLNTEDFRWIEPHPQRKQEALTESQWRAERVPQGFALSISQVEVNGDNRVEHHVYSDGLASVSVFAAPRNDGEEPMSGASRLGVTNAFGRVEGDFQITVIGEVPVDTVRFFGTSFRPRAIPASSKQQ